MFCVFFFLQQRTDERITNKPNKNDRFLFMIIRDYRNTFGLKYIEHFVALKLHVNCSRHFSYVFKILICLIRFLFVSEKKAIWKSKQLTKCTYVQVIFMHFNKEEEEVEKTESCTSYSLHMKWAIVRKMACKQNRQRKIQIELAQNLDKSQISNANSF